MATKSNKSVHRIPPEDLIKAKKEEGTMIKQRVKERKEKMIALSKRSVLRHYPQHYEHFGFNLSDDTVLQITDHVTSAFLIWDGGKYQKPLTKYKHSYSKVRIYWNREKPIHLGDHLFSTFCGVLFEYIMDIFGAKLSSKNRMLLFIDILETFLSENIRFKRSKARPLILHTCFSKENKFREFCSHFAECFGYEWDHTIQFTRGVTDDDGRRRYEYVQNPNRSQELHDAFLSILRRIKSDVSSNQQPELSQYTIGRVQSFIVYIHENMPIVDNAVREIQPITPSVESTEETTQNSENVPDNHKSSESIHRLHIDNYDDGYYTDGNDLMMPFNFNAMSAAINAHNESTEVMEPELLETPQTFQSSETVPSSLPPVETFLEATANNVRPHSARMPVMETANHNMYPQVPYRPHPHYVHNPIFDHYPHHVPPPVPVPYARTLSPHQCWHCQCYRYNHWSHNVVENPLHYSGYVAYRGPTHRVQQSRYNPYKY